MSVARMLENMKRRALDSTYDAYICEEYDAWAVDSFATEEGEYDTAMLVLPKVLNAEQMDKLKTMEERYQLNRKLRIIFMIISIITPPTPLSRIRA